MKTGVASSRPLVSELAPDLLGTARLDGALREGRLQLMLLFSDVLVLVVGLGAAYVLRYSLGLPDPLIAPPPDQLLQTSLLLCVTFVIVAGALGLYKIRRVWRYPELLFATSLTVASTMAVVSMVAYLAAHFYHRLFLAYFGIVVLFVLPVARHAWKRWLAARHANGKGLGERRLLFVGDSPLLQGIVRQIERHPELGYRIVALLPDTPSSDHAVSPERHLLVTGTLRAVSDALRNDQVDQVIFANSPKAYAEFAELVALCQGTGNELKRLIDIVVSGVGLALLTPLFALLAVVIKIDSPGPVFYRRRVIGAGGRTFVALKFRSMVEAAHEMLVSDSSLFEEYQRTLKITQDPRVTRLGRWLRKTSLDELPQLINVFKGEMSLVGPRMLGDIELARYGEYQQKALSIRPGITGLWQVSGRHETSFEERVQLDMRYVDEWSLGLDIQILLKTIPAVFGMRGAR